MESKGDSNLKLLNLNLEIKIDNKEVNIKQKGNLNEKIQ